MIRFARRYRYTITLLVICAAVGTWTILSGHVYHGPVSWWRLAIAGAAGGAGSALYNHEARRRR